MATTLPVHEAATRVQPSPPVSRDGSGPLVALHFPIVEKECEVPAAALETDASKIGARRCRRGRDPRRCWKLRSETRQLGPWAGVYDNHLGVSIRPTGPEPLQTTLKIWRLAARDY